MVDLGQVRDITAVKIWNRADCCSDWLEGFDIRIGDSASSYSTATACFTGGTAPLTSPYTVQVDCEGSGQFLYIGLPGLSVSLVLCEVEVYGSLYECASCPANAVSPPSSSSILDCKCAEGYTGPDGGPCGAEGGCPADFPFQDNNVPLCWKTSDLQAAGTGPCGTWCTKDLAVGGGCGDNADHLCS